VNVTGEFPVRLADNQSPPPVWRDRNKQTLQTKDLLLNVGLSFLATQSLPELVPPVLFAVFALLLVVLLEVVALSELFFS
jgi:hypothetical protein